jgi:hypothetical protein
MPTLVALWLALFALSTANADVLELRSGERVEGKFKQATAAGVVIEVGGQNLTFSLTKVRAIYLGTAPPRSVQTPVQASLFGEALRALKGIQSLARAGVDYREYTSHLNDATIQVDRYLQQPSEKDIGVRRPVEEALRLYVLAGNAWNTRFIPAEDKTTRQAAIGADPVLDRCPGLPPILQNEVITFVPGYRITDQAVLQKLLSSPGIIGSLLSRESGVTAIWRCASDKIAEAELLSGQKLK